MSFTVVTILHCDGKAHECKKRFELVGTSQKKALLDRAALADWRFYSRSQFCPECWAEVSKSLKITADNEIKRAGV